MALTAEDLAKLKAIREGTVPPVDVAIPQMDPVAAADPYNKSAQEYTTKATALETQAAQPRPEPQGAKQTLVAGLRNAMENMGRLGAPGGYYGQEEQRQQDFDKQNAGRIAQAGKLRDIAEKQQGLGINAENVARQENYNQGQLAETAQLRKRQEEQQQETARHNSQMETIAQNAPVKLTPGEGMYDRNGTSLASQPANPKQLRHTVLMNDVTKKPEVWSIDDQSQPVAKVGDAQVGGAGSGAGMLSVSSITDKNGNSIPVIVNKSDQSYTPIHNAGDKNDIPLTSDVGKANAKNDAGMAKDYQTSVNSLTAMAGFMQKAEANPQGAYALDQAMADQFFNIIKPGSGARMNEAQINRFITPGPLKDKMIVWAQKLSNGAPLDTDARRSLFEAARIAVNSKKPVPRGPAGGGAAPAASNGGWSVVGAQ